MQSPETTLMYAEAREAETAVDRFLSRNRNALVRIANHLTANPPVAVITVARGSSDHAATYAKYLIETYLSVPTSSAALSVVSIYAAPVHAARTVCIAISQSGRSLDVLNTVASYKSAGAYVVALVNDEASPLATLANAVLPLSAGLEKSVAATKSYITSLAGLAALVAAWSGNTNLSNAVDTLPIQLKTAFDLDWSPAVSTFKSATSLFVIGRGYSLAIAQEAALKFKETCGLHAEAFSAAEVRHGPMAIVNSGFPILAFATSDAAGEDVRQICADFKMRGAAVWLADTTHSDTTLPALQTEPALEPILMIASFYRLANRVSLALGLNPDAPPHLKKVTQTR